MRSSPSRVGLDQRAAGMSVAPSLLRDDKCLDGRILRWGWWVSAGRGRGSKYGVVYEALYSWVIIVRAPVNCTERRSTGHVRV